MFGWKVGLLTFLFEWHFMWVVYSVYIHREICHRYFIIHPALEHFFRFWAWLSMGFCWPNWMQSHAAKHRKHHATSDSSKDPTTPFYFSFKQLLEVSHHQNPTKANYMAPGEIEFYAPDIKSADDWVERNIYQKYPKIGLLWYWWIFHTILFGWLGFVIGGILYWGIKKNILTIYVNVMLHKFGFTYEPNIGTDKSKIVFPIAVLWGGEELHTHHHNDPSKPYNTRYWFEFDIGWAWCKLFMLLGLMSLRNKF
jgi:stearoyl-CoA desaturase (delta-9 desaturase)